MKKSLFLTVSFFSGFLIQAQEFNKTKMDSLFNSIDSNNLAMGSFSIFSNGTEAYSKTIGYSDISNKQKANGSTKYRIGSITKTFTAVVLMQLIEEGKLALNTSLATYFPDIPNASKMTVDNLLRHQSGLFNITDDENFRTWMVVPQSRKAMLDRMIKNGVLFEPGEETRYSNTNYLLLSYIAEDIENKTYPEIVEERIIEKLGLKNTFYGKDIEPENNEALSYYKSEDNWELASVTDMSVPMGAGAIVSTPTDLNKFFESIFSENIISAKSLSTMMMIKDGFGIGMMQLPLGGMEIYGHGGGIDGFSSIAVHIPQENISAAYITNAADFPTRNAVIGALQIFLARDFELPESQQNEK